MQEDIKFQINQLQLQIFKITFVYPEEIKAIKKMIKMDSDLEKNNHI
jgi:hypothetical protein